MNQENPSAGPPAGWYLMGASIWGWWDGSVWNDSRHHVPPAARNETKALGPLYAALAWAASLAVILVPIGFLVFIPALILFSKNRPGRPGADPFVRFSTGEALNTQMTLTCVWLLGVVVAYGPGTLIAVYFTLLFVASVVLYICFAIGAVRASSGIWWKVPITIPFLRQHRELAKYEGQL